MVSGAPPLLRPAFHSALPGQILAESEAGVCWVYAAPGAGKTCAVRVWAEKQAAPVHWFSVLPEHRDPVCCAMALRRLFLGAQDRGLSGFLSQVERDLASAWDLLLNELDARMNVPTWIVIDGLEHCPEVDQHPIWSTLLLRPFQRLRWVVTSRLPIPSSWSRWRVNRHIVCFGFDTLRWSLREAHEWVALWGGPSVPSRAEIEKALEKSEGWGAGFEFLVRSAAGQQVMSPAIAAQWQRMSQQLPSADPSWATLLALSRRRRVDAALVLDVDPTGALMDLLHRLAEPGFILRASTTRDGARHFTFHPLFADIVGHTGQVRSPTSKQAQALARVFEKHALLVDGLIVLGRAALWEQWVALLDRHAIEVCKAHGLEVLAPFLDALPGEFRQDPSRRWLGVMVGLCEDREGYERAMQQFKSAGQDSSIEPQWRAIALGAAVHRALGQGRDYAHLPDCLRLIEAFLLEVTSEQMSPRFHLQLNLSALVCALLVDPGHPRHGSWRDTVLHAPAEYLADSSNATLAASLVQTYALTGWVEYARQIYNLLSWSDHGDASRQTRIAIRAARFFIGVISGTLDELIELSDELERLWEQEPDAPWRTATQVFSAFAALCIGDRSRLSSTVARLTAGEGNRSPFVALCEPLLESLIGASNSDYDAILRGQRRCLEVADELGACFYQSFVRAGIAMNLLEQRKISEATGYLKKAEALNARFLLPVSTWTTSLASAYRDLIQGESERCSERLRGVLTCMRKAGCFALPLHFHRGYTELLTHAFEQGIEVEYLTDLIRRTKKYHHYVKSPAWPAKYELRVLGAFSLRVDGQDKTTKFRLAAHRFELMTALALLGGRDVREDDLIACVWPHVRVDAGTRLRQALRRLGQSLGRSDALLWSQDQTVSLNPQLWRFDLWDAGSLLEELEHQLRGPCPNPKSLQRKMLALKAQVSKAFVGPTQIPARLRPEAEDALACKTRLEQLREGYEQCVARLAAVQGTPRSS